MNEKELLTKIRGKTKERPLLIGRRGLAEEYPENTVPSFEAAVKAKCDAIELDVRATLDGKLVCCHDEFLWRCVNLEANPEIKGSRVEDMTLKEIHRIDVGGWKGPRFAGLTMPTLEEALEVILPGAIPVIERKSGTADQILQALDKVKARKRVVLCDFDWDALNGLQTKATELVTAANGTGPFDVRNVQRLSAHGASIINWEYYGLTRSDAAAILEGGFLLWTWKIDHEFEFQDSLKMGASGIISDRPSKLRKLIG